MGIARAARAATTASPTATAPPLVKMFRRFWGMPRSSGRNNKLIRVVHSLIVFYHQNKFEDGINPTQIT